MGLGKGRVRTINNLDDTSNSKVGGVDGDGRRNCSFRGGSGVKQQQHQE